MMMNIKDFGATMPPTILYVGKNMNPAAVFSVNVDADIREYVEQRYQTKRYQFVGRVDGIEQTIDVSGAWIRAAMPAIVSGKPFVMSYNSSRQLWSAAEPQRVDTEDDLEAYYDSYDS